MKQIVSLFAGILFLCACNSSTDAPSIQTNLEESYQTDSKEQYIAYLLKWHSESNPISQNEFEQLSDTLKAIYELYETFYNPLDLNQYCTIGRCPEFGPDIYDGLKFFVIQDKINYTFTPDIIANLQKKAFRPRINFDQIALYLSDKYKTELDSFLNRDTHPEDIQERYDFLNKQLKIMPGHWFGWHYLTHPEVDTIYFNSALDSASVHFRIVFEGGEANYKRSGDKWELVESRLTWIE